MLKTISLRITYFLFYVGHTRCTNGVSEFFCRFIVMISHENLCLNHVFMPRRLCFELIFCTRNSVAEKEGQNFSDLALLARAYYASLRHHALVGDLSVFLSFRHYQLVQCRFGEYPLVQCGEVQAALVGIWYYFGKLSPGKLRQA